MERILTLTMMRQLYLLSFIFAVHQSKYKLMSIVWIIINLLIVCILNITMTDPRIEEIKQALIANQSGSGLDDIRVYMGHSRQYGQGFGDYLRNVIHTAVPVVMRIAKTLFKTSSDSLKEGSSIGDFIKAPI